MADLQAVKKLREETGRSVGQIQEALEQAEGDLDQAKKLLRKSGEMIVDTKASRLAKSGVIETYMHSGRIGVLLEVNVETDFAAKSDQFKNFVHDVALQISSMAPKNVEELMNQPFVKDETKTMGALLKETIATVGENIVVARFTRYQLGGE